LLGSAGASIKTPAPGRLGHQPRVLDLSHRRHIIVGDQIVYGEDMDALAAAIAKARGRRS